MPSQIRSHSSAKRLLGKCVEKSSIKTSLTSTTARQAHLLAKCADIVQSELFNAEIYNEGILTLRTRDAPFITEAWNSKEVLRIVSEIAGVELVPALSYDTGHCNISVNGRGTENDTAVAPGEEKSENKEGYCESAFGWHTDSYPFVVVTMLSDCTGMVGGETRIRTGDGRPMAARGPQMVCAFWKPTISSSSLLIYSQGYCGRDARPLR